MIEWCSLGSSVVMGEKCVRGMNVNICIKIFCRHAIPPPKFFHGELTIMTILTKFFYCVAGSIRPVIRQAHKTTSGKPQDISLWYSMHRVI